MKRFWKSAAAAVLCFGLLLGPAGCGGNKGDDTEKKAPGDETSGQSVVIRLQGGDTGLPNPFKHYVRGPGLSKMQLLYDSLLEKDENGDISWLADSWKISDDGTEYTFKLRDNLTWHDGRSLTAEDVKFTFEYYREHPPVSNDLIIDGKYIIQSIEIVDPQTVRLTVDAPSASYLSKIGYMRILPRHIWGNVEDPMTFTGAAATVGSGPYVMEEYDAQQGIYRFKAFEKYWGPRPRVDVIEWVPVSDPILAFENEEIDLVNATPDVLSRYENNPEYKVEKKHSFHNYRLMMNMEKRPELKDVNIRKAIACAIDRNELMEKVERGSAVIGSMGYVPEGSKWYNGNTAKYPYDLQKARELLGGRQLSFNVLVGNTDKEVKIAELIKLTLEQAGIKLTIESVDSKVRDTAVQQGEYELSIINSGGMGGDPDYLRNLYASNPKAKSKGLGSGAVPGYYNERVRTLALRQARELDPEKRKKTIFELQELIAEEVPMILLYGQVDNHVYRPAKYDGWMFRYDHTKTDHCKLSYLERNGA
ncbi:ABC transporter substrate-binding protein [Desulfoscipio gibsoniae]